MLHVDKLGENDGDAITFLDHVAADDGAVSILDHDAVPQMVVEVITGHAEIEAVVAINGVEILLEVIADDDDVVAEVEV